MHGMVNRGLQAYVSSIFSFDVWEEACTRAGLSFFNFETVLVYDDGLTDRIIGALAQILGRPRPEILEDFGTFVVAERSHSALRRLLHFGGPDFVTFLGALEEVQDISRVVLPDLDMPRFELTAHGKGRFTLDYRFAKPGYGAVFLGLLRAMADDYGTLVLIDHVPRTVDGVDCDRFDIQVLRNGLPGAGAGPNAPARAVT